MGAKWCLSGVWYLFLVIQCVSLKTEPCSSPIICPYLGQQAQVQAWASQRLQVG